VAKNRLGGGDWNERRRRLGRRRRRRMRWRRRIELVMLVADQFFCQQSFSLVPHKSRAGDFSHIQLTRVSARIWPCKTRFHDNIRFCLLNPFLTVFHIKDNLPSVIPSRTVLINYCDYMQTVTVQENSLDSSSECWCAIHKTDICHGWFRIGVKLEENRECNRQKHCPTAGRYS